MGRIIELSNPRFQNGYRSCAENILGDPIPSRYGPHDDRHAR